ncbi:glycosyltransferase family 69 protein [Lepidopterella palustris CBS 459.81]|uniref:Glycosyltransferase family 69 protein n=1 Tax=Lepidopterella palustris CBS 459.81 TaxID=1314670 RepID=A0A8E2JC73_9PEZI|nr:glycosyltransferase family 69 protein [Lepidopterella palustris CBS 459.81]
MASRLRRSSQDYELLPRSSSESGHSFHASNNASFKLHENDPQELLLLSWLRLWRCRSGSIPSRKTAYSRISGPRRHRRRAVRLLYWLLIGLPYFLALLVLFVAAFRPSYTHRPAHYTELHERTLRSSKPGRANLYNEKVFIAASIYEKGGFLTGGAWGEAILNLVDLLGPENVYLSVYENDPDTKSKESLESFEKRVNCNSSIVAEHLSFDTIPRVTLPSGEKRIKRIAFLAEVRNRALIPLESSGIIFDKLLFINDVIFDPVEAVQLLFSTHVGPDGRTQYGAACAVDFINPFKFYDRFATRDLEGNSMGIPFFPWFTDAGSKASRQDVLDQKDAVRVRSCWGGMTAFEAKWFQPSSINRRELAKASNESSHTVLPLRFRFEEDTFWDSSECCLIHADLQYVRSGLDVFNDSGIYMNPYIRVAYDEQTLGWLALTRRPERLYSFIHNFLDHMAGLPASNPRRKEEPGDMVTETVWKYDDPKAALLGNITAEGLKGSYHEVNRIAGPGGFCGGRKLLLINEHPQESETKWANIPIPIPTT